MAIMRALPSDKPINGDGAERINMRFEVVVIPVADVDRSKEFYGGLDWRLDADFSFDNGFRVVQFTPPGSEGSVQTFSDPDGNTWLLQEVTKRLAGRVDPAQTSFTSVPDLAGALRRAAAAHGEHEKRTGQQDAN